MCVLILLYVCPQTSGAGVVTADDTRDKTRDKNAGDAERLPLAQRLAGTVSTHAASDRADERKPAGGAAAAQAVGSVHIRHIY